MATGSDSDMNEPGIAVLRDEIRELRAALSAMRQQPTKVFVPPPVKLPVYGGKDDPDCWIDERRGLSPRNNWRKKLPSCFYETTFLVLLKMKFGSVRLLPQMNYMPYYETRSGRKFRTLRETENFTTGSSTRANP